MNQNNRTITGIRNISESATKIGETTKEQDKQYETAQRFSHHLFIQVQQAISYLIPLKIQLDLTNDLIDCEEYFILGNNGWGKLTAMNVKEFWLWSSRAVKLLCKYNSENKSGNHTINKPNFIESDGITVWVHRNGETIARFGVMGIDIHRPIAEQVEGKPICLACTHERTTSVDWDQFIDEVLKFYNIKIPSYHRPSRFMP